MSLYSPDPVPFDVDAIPAYLQREFAKIAAVTNLVQMETLYVEPSKLFDGLVVMADGTDWNPTGGGQGVYVFYGAAWHKLG